MDGLHDGQAIKTIVADLQPRKLIVVQSTEHATQALLDFFKSNTAMTHDIFHPGTNEVVRIGEHVQSYSLQLGDSITALLNGKWSKFEGYEVAMVDGKYAFASGSTVPTLEAAGVELPPLVTDVKEEMEGDVKPEIAGDETAVEVVGEVVAAEMEADVEAAAAEASAEAAPATATDIENVKIEVEEPVSAIETVEVDMEPAPAISSAPAHLPSSLFIGDLRLLALKNRLASLSIPAEFAGEGMLVCGPGVLARTRGAATDDKKSGGSIVAVRKLPEGQVILEGNISATYFAVRKELYSSYAQVTTM